MPEYTAIAAQTVAANQNVLFTEAPIPCTKGLVTHRAGSGLFNLRGNCSQCRVRYKVDFIGNIAVSTGGTPGPISVAIAVDGEPLPSSVATVTPTVAGHFSTWRRPSTLTLQRAAARRCPSATLVARPLT